MIPPIRKANADDEDAELQATTGGSAGGVGFKVAISSFHESYSYPRYQPIGAELDKDAQVWEIYVDETDRSDREMVKGWTELVIESSKQLQPDPAETSVQLLMAMSQTLVAISNGQAVDSSSLPSSPTSGFLLSPSSVLVNMLWFLSLTLSVAVSLVAMLSKSWCYMFMANRTGPKYEQGRRRQKKWDGIKRWRMVGVFVYLPMLMHLALRELFVCLSIVSPTDTPNQCCL
ncbi:hypothetical protein FRC07_005398 [Ceratobasidium sp. 392]|nr:hypothetical protein FRC07_005398 [Ceratobasidium sp. 392]